MTKLENHVLDILREIGPADTINVLWRIRIRSNGSFVQWYDCVGAALKSLCRKGYVRSQRDIIGIQQNSRGLRMVYRLI